MSTGVYVVVTFRPLALLQTFAELLVSFFRHHADERSAVSVFGVERPIGKANGEQEIVPLTSVRNATNVLAGNREFIAVEFSVTNLNRDHAGLCGNFV